MDQQQLLANQLSLRQRRFIQLQMKSQAVENNKDE